MQTLNDQKLVAAIKGSVKQRNSAISVLVCNKLLKHKVRKLVTARGGTKEDSQEIFNDSLLIFLKNVIKDNFKAEYTIEQYIIGIARYLWYREYKQKCIKVTVELTDQIYTPDEKGIDWCLAKKDQMDGLNDLMNLLSQPCREILRLWALGFTTKEIAEKIGYSEGYTRLKIFRCKRKMKEILAKHNELVEKLKQ